MSDILLPKEQEGGADIDFWRELLENDQPYGLLPKPPPPAASKSRRPTVRLVVEKKYDPSQPRAPKGSPDGGQWTDESGAAGGGVGPQEGVNEPQQEERRGGRTSITFKGYAKGFETDELDKFGITKMHIREMFSLPGYDAKVLIQRGQYFDEKVMVEATWKDPTTKKVVGHCKRLFVLDRQGEKYCINDELVFLQEFQSKGLAQELYEKQIRVLAETSVPLIRLNANVSIGRYAWAKRGFQYRTKNLSKEATRQFEYWATERGIKKPDSGWPVFKTPQDVANYTTPGVKVPHTAITNPDIKPGDYEVGKAFMLDKDGHGSWSAELWLKNRS